MDTRSKKNTLTEDEVHILQEQLLRKQQQLKEQEEALHRKHSEAEERLNEIDSKEKEYNLRYREIDEQYQDQTRNNETNLNSRVEQLLTNMMTNFNLLQKEVVQIRADIQPGQQGTSREGAPDVSSGPHNPQYTGPTWPQLTFKDALESVPIFNGENIPLLKFTRACNRIKDMFPANQEPTLARLLRNKLKGRAYTAVEDDNFETVKEFTDVLKGVFGATKSVNQYRGELGSIVKARYEHTIDYISRVKDLHAAILEEETASKGPLRATTIKDIEVETLECFVAGLPPTFRTNLKIEGYTKLSEAYSAAIKVEKEFEKDRFKFKEQRQESKPHVSFTKPEVKTSESITCTFCKKPGHESERCWIKHPDKRPSRNNNNNGNDNFTFKPGQSSPPRFESRVTCLYCGKPGHDVASCYAKQRDERTSGNGSSRPAAGASRPEVTYARPLQTTQTLDA